MSRTSPIRSTRPSGSNSSVSRTRVRSAPTSSKNTAPAFVAPVVAAHATFSSGTCATISASHSRRTPAICAIQCVIASLTCRTSSTPDMKCGNSSNRVHWS